MKVQRKNRAKHRYSLLVSLALLWLCACNPLEEGCLDVDAENFSFDAGRHVQNLCQYPDLILNVFYQWADSSLQIAHLYTNDAGMDYAIHGVQVLLSGFLVTDAQQEEHTIENRLDIVTGDCATGMPRSVPDDFVLVDRSAFNYAIGPFRVSGPMTRFRLTVGVLEDVTPLCIELLPQNHRLRNPRTGYDAFSGAFALSRFVISRDSITAVRDTVFGYLDAPDLMHDVMRTFRPGRRDTIFLAIDFQQVFNPANLDLLGRELGDDLASRVPAAIAIQ